MAQGVPGEFPIDFQQGIKKELSVNWSSGPQEHFLVVCKKDLMGKLEGFGLGSFRSSRETMPFPPPSLIAQKCEFIRFCMKDIGIPRQKHLCQQSRQFSLGMFLQSVFFSKGYLGKLNFQIILGFSQQMLEKS